MVEIKRVFKVNGKPFFPIGAQSCNSSGYNENESEQAFKIIKLLHGNTLEIPVYWEQVEPQEGKFDFSAVDALLASARRYEVKLILLWFASWKNGNMDYVPAWVKTNQKRFKRVISKNGDDVWDLSSRCQANLEADKKAFVALCQHLREKDSADQTVVALQIENEPGILGSDRDYSPEAQAEYDSLVPAKLVTSMKKAGKGQVYEIWQQSGGKTGSWPEMFGWQAGELMTAWSIARYIDNIAATAKKVYDIPMYVNVWLMEHHGWVRAGESYPSGGAVSKVLDIYKWFTPHLDFIAPDNYQMDSYDFAAVCAAYARDDNPFFMPETIGDANMFRAMTDYNCIGNMFFGAEFVIADDGTIRPDSQNTIDCIRCTAAISPLLLKYQGTGKVHAFVQDDNQAMREKELNGFTLLVEYGDKRPLWAGKDWRHRAGSFLPITPTTRGKPAYGLLIQANKNEFYMVGANCRFYLRPQPTLESMESQVSIGEGIAQNFANWVSVDEGHFDRNGEFVADRRRSGDEVGRRGFWVEPDINVVRVITCD